MATRDRSHVIGDKAVRKISDLLIPEEWTISIPDADYGLDMLVEIVKDDRTTGKFFFVQSKGTDKGVRKGKIDYRIDVEHLKDYSRIKLPILFVLYSRSENKFWGCWINSIYSSLSENEKHQKSLTLSFRESDNITADSLWAINEVFSLDIVNSITIRASGVITDGICKLNKQIQSLVQSEIDGYITESNKLSIINVDIQYNGDLNDGCVIVSSKNGSISIPIMVESYDFLYLKPVSNSDCPIFVRNILLSIAVLSSVVSHKSIEYVLTNISRSSISIIPRDVWEGFIMNIPSGMFNQLMNAFKLFVQEEQLLLAQLIMMKVFIDDRALYPHLVQQFINEVRDDSMKGCLYYNLANSLRHYDKLTDSISCYLKARKYEPDYLNRNYWWKELAGVMFVSGHPRFAELFYKKAMSLSGKDEISNLPLLISDCLVVQGKYEEACYTENQYLSNISSETDVNDYLLFKFSITRMMFEQINGPTNNLELFNDGLNYANKGEYEMASYLFLCAWRLDERDNEALSNAFISSLNTGNLQLSLRIMKAIKSLFPEKGYNQIVKSIIGKGKILTKGHNDALDALSDLFDKL